MNIIRCLIFTFAADFDEDGFKCRKQSWDDENRRSASEVEKRNVFEIKKSAKRERRHVTEWRTRSECRCNCKNNSWLNSNAVK